MIGDKSFFTCRRNGVFMLDFIRIITSFSGTLAFALLFNIRGKNLLFASLGGLVCGIVFYIFSLVSEREALSFFAASVAVAAYAEIAARILKAPATIFSAPGLIPLVPGGNLYYTMAAALHGNMADFFNCGMQTAYIALAIAAGILVVSPIKRLIVDIFEQRLDKE